MSIEKILARTLAVLAGVFLLLTLTFYPPRFAIIPAVFLMIFVGANFLLPDDSKESEKKPGERLLSNFLVILLALAVLTCLGCLIVLWKFGHFGYMG